MASDSSSSICLPLGLSFSLSRFRPIAFFLAVAITRIRLDWCVDGSSSACSMSVSAAVSSAAMLNTFIGSSRDLGLGCVLKKFLVAGLSLAIRMFAASSCLCCAACAAAELGTEVRGCVDCAACAAGAALAGCDAGTIGTVI